MTTSLLIYSLNKPFSHEFLISDSDKTSSILYVYLVHVDLLGVK